MVLVLTLLNANTITGQIYNGENMEYLNNTLITLEDKEGSIIFQKVFDSEYEYEASPGEYVLRAYYYQNGELKYYTQHNIKVDEEIMELDIILIPYELQELVPGFEPPPLLQEPEESDPEQDYTYLIYLGIIVVVIISLVLIFNLKNKRKVVEKSRRREPKEKVRKIGMDEDSKKVLKIIEENEGRIEQKELRKILKFSETKMSLVVSELEVTGLIKRIKKGRKNILKLKKLEN